MSQEYLCAEERVVNGKSAGIRALIGGVSCRSI